MCVTDSLARSPGIPRDAAALLAQARCLLEARTRLIAAIDLFHVAQAHGARLADCAAGRWTCWMLLGQFERAWRESDLLDRAGAPDPNRLWDGAAFEGRRVLVRALHGYGDAVQFIRYAPLIRRRAQRVIIQCHPDLLELLRRVDGVDEVISWPDPPLSHPWDQQIEIMELPRAFRTELGSIPARMPYISVARKLHDSAALPVARADALKIGLIWQSSGYDPSRSMALESLAALLDLTGAQFFSFQYGDARTQISARGSQLNDATEGINGVLGTAARLCHMDLLISVDTFGAHLAGALNIPVWLMLPFAADWRWMMERPDSPWYPRMKLFRQPAAGAWAPVVDAVRGQLEQLVRGRR